LATIILIKEKIMNSKITLVTFFLLTTFTAVSESTYSGTVEKQIQGQGIVTISGQQYLIDHSTVVHGMVEQGEVGPIFNTGSEIDFKLDRSGTKETPHISESWIIE